MPHTKADNMHIAPLRADNAIRSRINANKQNANDDNTHTHTYAYDSNVRLGVLCERGVRNQMKRIIVGARSERIAKHNRQIIGALGGQHITYIYIYV